MEKGREGSRYIHGDRDMLVEQTTGPWMLLRSVQNFQKYVSQKDEPLVILEPEHVYPLNWNAPYPAECLQQSNSWNETGPLNAHD